MAARVLARRGRARAHKSLGARRSARSRTLHAPQVDETHAKFCAALVALFDRHKAARGCADATLEII